MKSPHSHMWQFIKGSFGRRLWLWLAVVGVGVLILLAPSPFAPMGPLPSGSHAPAPRP